MMYSNDRNQLRQVYFDTWKKHKNKQPLEPIELQVLEVILAHPEYHHLLENIEHNLDKNYFVESGETNPFMHMGLHLGIKDQVATNRPKGITRLYKQLLIKYQDEQTVEHLMMDYLVEGIWQAQRDNTLPDENSYLKKLKRLLK